MESTPSTRKTKVERTTYDDPDSKTHAEEIKIKRTEEE
jgi:hypothetical protein